MTDKPWAKGPTAICEYCEYEVSSWGSYLRQKLKKLNLLSYDGNRPVLDKRGWDRYLLQKRKKPKKSKLAAL